MSDAENRGQATGPEEKVTDSTLQNVASLSQTAGAHLSGIEESAHRELGAGEKLGKYGIQKKLGQGGMGAVYLAFDPMIEREVAIKVLPPQIAEKPTALARFFSEARATGKLNHPNVVAIYDIAQQGNIYYIVMELVRGGSGAEFIANRQTFDWRQATQVAADACTGLAAAHAVGLVHRDIKPENIMLSTEGTAKVVDFGLSKIVDVANEGQLGLTNAGRIMGTPQYMSPEQFKGQHVDARSDVYGMGATLFTLLTGQRPYQDAGNLVHLMMAHLQTPPPDPTDVDPEIPVALKRIIAKAMAKDPDQRYRDAGDFAAALHSILADSSDCRQLGAAQLNRPLKTVVAVEPSRMQAMMLRDALLKAGASEVAVCSSKADAYARCESDPPELLITAMQLSDGKGVELIRQLREDLDLHDSLLVLNSSDSDIERLLETVQTGPLAVVSKKTKPDDLLRAIHGSTFLDVGSMAPGKELDPSTLQYGFACDSAKIPDSIASLIRQGNLLDVQIATYDELAAGNASFDKMDLVLALRTAGDAVADTRLYTDLLSRVKSEATRLLAAVQVDGRRLTLRAVQRRGFTAVARCELDVDRIRRLVQLC